MKDKQSDSELNEALRKGQISHQDMNFIKWAKEFTKSMKAQKYKTPKERKSPFKPASKADVEAADRAESAIQYLKSK
jgi:hypothetical protein